MDIKTLIFYVSLLGGLVATLPIQLVYRVLKLRFDKEQRAAFCTRVGMRLAKKYIKLTNANFDIQGLERIPEGTVLFVSNHQSYFDLAVFLGFIPKPKGYMAKASLSKIPILKYWMQELQCVFIERGDAKKAARALTEGIKVLRGGQSLVIFPEGRRSKDGMLGDFKGGSIKLATKAKVPIVPVSIDGTYRMLEGNGGRICPAQVRVYVHEAIPTRGLSGEELEGLSDRVREVVSSGINMLKTM